MAEEPIVLKTSVRKPCPKCGKLFKPTGLAGHLRWVHGLSGDAARKLWERTPLDSASLYDGAFDLMDNIERVRQRRQRVKESYGSFFKPEVLERALSALDEQEKRLLAELEAVKDEKPTLQSEHADDVDAERSDDRISAEGETQTFSNKLVQVTMFEGGGFELRDLQTGIGGETHKVTRDNDGKWHLESWERLDHREQLKADRAAREAAARTKADKTHSRDFISRILHGE